MSGHTQGRVALGRVIRRLRQGRCLSIEALAHEAGMSPGRLGRVERGQGNPKVSELLALSKALGVTVTQIVLAAEDEEASCHGERRLTPEEFEEHFGHLPTDGEG